jgi:uncharacterized protein DUF2510
MNEQGQGPEHSIARESPVPAGWYPDPTAVAERRYWDGKEWTDHLHTESAKPPPARSKRDLPRLAIALGAFGIAISPFMTWVHVDLLGSLDLFQLAEAGGSGLGVIWAIVLIGVLSALLAWRTRRRWLLRVVGLLVGLVVGFVASAAVVGMIEGVRETDGIVTMSVGPWVATLGCLSMLLGGLFSFRRR